MTRIEALKAELADIECLDRFYWQTENPDRHEKLGYLLRQDRRRDVITELLNLMQGRCAVVSGVSFVAFPQEERQAMKRPLLIATLAMVSLVTSGNTSADRKQCCHGCGSYGCNQTNCGDKCSAGPHCSGCWKSCLR